MRNEGLVTSVLGILAGQEVITPAPDLMPEVEKDVQIHLGKPDPVMGEVRQRLTELQNGEKAELVEQRRELVEKRNAELKLVEEGEASVDSMMKAGKTREEIIAARSASSVAQELAMGLERQIDELEDQIDAIDRRWSTKRSQIKASFEGIETSARAWLMDYIQGGNVNRLNPERGVRAYRQMLQRERMISETLQDDDLSARAILTCATFVCPETVWATLFAVMPDRYHKEFEDDTPEQVLARIQSSITGGSE